MSAEATSGSADLVPRAFVRPRQSFVTASGWAALLTAAVAIWVAIESRIYGPGWLLWLAAGLPPAVAGALCLARRRATSMTPAAVLASCAVMSAYTVSLPEGRTGVVVVASVLLVICAGITVVISGIVTAVLMGISGSFSRRRAAVWVAAGLVFAALSIPSPVYFIGTPIQTIFAGNTSGENAAGVCYLVLLALPLLVAGLASAQMAAVIAVAWLAEAVPQLLGWYVNLGYLLRLDAWYYVNWGGWLLIAALTLAEARNSRSGNHAR